MSQVSDNQAASEEEYRNIFEAASDGLLIYDIGLDSVVEVNSAACEMHGYNRPEFIGLNPAVLMLPESHAPFIEQVRAAERGRVFELLIVHIRKDGSSFHAEVRRSPINYRGRPCLLNTIRDVSQRIQTEKILAGQVKAQMHSTSKPINTLFSFAATLTR